MTIGEPPLCWTCKHLFFREKDGVERWHCTAHPDWGTPIPDEILDWEVDHRKPYEGDNGIQYEPKSKGGKK